MKKEVLNGKRLHRDIDKTWRFALLNKIYKQYSTKLFYQRLLTGGLDAHLERHLVEYLQFSFRWMNNLLMREMPLRCTVRLWDTYLVSRRDLQAVC